MRDLTLRSIGLVLLASAFLIGFGVISSSRLNLATTISIYLFITLAIADKAGFAAASVVSIVATLCLEYYFAPPLFSLRVNRSEDWAALATFEGISLIVSRLSHRARNHQLMLQKQSLELQALYGLSRDLLMLDWKKSPQQQLCALINGYFPLRGVAIWNAYDGALSWQGETPYAEETARAIFFGENNYDDESHRNSFRVLFFGTRAMGALMLYGHSLSSLSINSIASISAMSIERTRSLTLEMNVEAERQSEQLRSTVLDGLAHAFKTPLSTITIVSSGLLAQDQLNERQSNLVDLINQEATRLSDLTTRLLRTSRLEKSQFVLHEKPTEIRTLLREVLNECAFQLKSRQIDVTIIPPGTCIQCDPQLLSLALVQILDNAAKYGSEHTPVLISAESHGPEFVLCIHNQGSYIPPTERHKVFSRFYRCPSVEHTVPGTGLGLLVAKKAIDAHGGKISIESDVQAGTSFVISIPAKVKELT